MTREWSCRCCGARLAEVVPADAMIEFRRVELVPHAWRIARCDLRRGEARVICEHCGHARVFSTSLPVVIRREGNVA